MEQRCIQTRIFLPPSSNILNEVSDGSIVVAVSQDPLPVDAEDVRKGVSASNNGWLAVPQDGGQRILVVKVSATRELSLQSVPVPDGRVCTCCTIHGEWLFVATSAGDLLVGPPALHAISLNSPYADWTDIPMNPDAIRARRVFDDLIIVGGQLVALDNMMYTKQLFRFDIARFPQSDLLSSDVFFSGLYAEADRIVCGNTWAAAKCSTSHDMGGSDDIVLWSIPSWQKIGEIHQSRSLRQRIAGDPIEDDAVFMSSLIRIEALGSLLLFESLNGLGVLDVNSLLSEWESQPRGTGAQQRNQFQALVRLHCQNLPSMRGPITVLPHEQLLAINGDVARAFTELEIRSLCSS